MTRFRHSLTQLAAAAFLILCVMQVLRPLLTMQFSGVPQADTREYRVGRHLIPEVAPASVESLTPTVLAPDALLAVVLDDPDRQLAVEIASEAPLWLERGILALCRIRSALSDPLH